MINTFYRKWIILGILFLLPVIFLLFLYPSTHNYNALDIVNEDIVEIDFLNFIDNRKTNFEGNITILNFLGDKPIDVLINNAGIGSTNQHFQAVSPKPWLEVLTVNLIAPLMVTQSIIDNVKTGVDKKIYFLSSQLGSIEDNTSGGMYIYRSSKTGLNQIVKSLSVDLEPQGITVVSLNPGWVKTDMGVPNATVSIDESVGGMIRVIEATDIKHTGKFLNYDGRELPW